MAPRDDAHTIAWREAQDEMADTLTGTNVTAGTRKSYGCHAVGVTQGNAVLDLVGKALQRLEAL